MERGDLPPTLIFLEWTSKLADSAVRLVRALLMTDMEVDDRCHAGQKHHEGGGLRAFAALQAASIVRRFRLDAANNTTQAKSL